jgi:L-fucose mutarotase/ribose pyranase (RbsD/FucU family)
VPVDTFVDEPVIRMEVVGAPDDPTGVPRSGLVATSEARPYGCFLITTGVV